MRSILEAFERGTRFNIHVDDINLVVHVDPPAEHKAYTHRSGRTARAGADGVVVTLMTPDQHGDVRVLTRQAGIKPQQAAVVPGDALLKQLAGPAADYVTPAPEPVVAPRSSSPRSSGAGRGGAAGAAGGRRRSGGGGSPARSASGTGCGR